MQTINREKVQQAVDFIKKHARPFEQRLYAHYFEGAPAADALRELEAFQNPDGGFGRALEPDFRLPDSSPKATSMGLRLLRDLGAGADDPRVQHAIDWLVKNYDPQRAGWLCVPAEVNRHPHAPWWQVDPATGGCAADSTAHPTAEIFGYFHLFGRNLPAGLMDAVEQRLVKHLEEVQDGLDQLDIEHFDFLLDVLHEKPRGDLDGRVLSAMNRSVPVVVQSSEAEWTNYGMQPLMIVRSPDSPFYPIIADAVQANLDYRIKSQGEDGGWDVTWAWAEYPEDWAKARTEWRGMLTLDALRVLRAFGRME